VNSTYTKMHGATIKKKVARSTWHMCKASFMVIKQTFKKINVESQVSNWSLHFNTIHKYL